MPFVRSDGARIYYEVRGSGSPLLLIESWGYSSWMWFRQLDAFSREHACVIFDNRGVGLSDKPDEPYTVALMAKDAINVLKAAGFVEAHVLGVSLGGFIAQEMAISWPEFVKSLVLVSTSCGVRGVPMPLETFKILNLPKGTMPLRDWLKMRLLPAFSERFAHEHPEVVERVLDLYMANRPPAHAVWRQAQAAAAFDSLDRLGEVRAPTLIIAGSDDRVVPAENARILHERIPNSRLVLFKGCGHLLFIEKPDAFNELVLRFLKSVDEGCPELEPKYMEI
mgnify:CR=1 FL=1